MSIGSLLLGDNPSGLGEITRIGRELWKSLCSKKNYIQIAGSGCQIWGMYYGLQCYANNRLSFNAHISERLKKANVIGQESRICYKM